MTVKELKEYLSKIDDNVEVIAKDKAHFEIEQILNIKMDEGKLVIVVND